MKNKYEVIKINTKDYKTICIGNIETDKVLCHFVNKTSYEFEQNSKLADDICKYLNEKSEPKQLQEQLQQPHVSVNEVAVCRSCGKPKQIEQRHVCQNPKCAMSWE